MDVNQPPFDRLCDLYDKLQTRQMTTQERNEYDKLYFQLSHEDRNALNAYARKEQRRNHNRVMAESEERQVDRERQLIARGKVLDLYSWITMKRRRRADAIRNA